MTKPDLELKNYDYKLPQELIAQYPCDRRDHSRLLVYDRKSNKVNIDYFYNLDLYIAEKSQLVLNDSKVFSSRMIGHKESGGKAEMLVLMPYADKDGYFEVLLKSRGKKKIGDIFFFSDREICIEIISILASSFKVKFLNSSFGLKQLEKFASIPIPPYIRGGIESAIDKERYQTVYAKNLGAVAAPTAGLHFTPEVFKKLEKKSIEQNYLTLNVGPGTFMPVKEPNILNHSMHKESFKVDLSTINNINSKRKSFKTYAVGTTSLRVLASLYNYEKDLFDFSQLQQNAEEYYGATEIFLHPPHKIEYIDGLITNFHLPKSTLMMLVSCLIGREKLLHLYKIAIENKMRFYSYGDSMIII